MTSRKFSVIAILAIIALSMIARPPISSMGALLPEIAKSLGLDSVQMGLVASAPVFLFGFGAFVSPWLARRFGINQALLFMAILLTAALTLRVSGTYEFLLLGTIGVGIAIAVINVLLPNVIRSEFKNHVAAATGLYTALFGLTASAAAALSVPISSGFGGWQTSLGFWALVALVVVIIWVPFVRNRAASEVEFGLPNVGPADRSTVLRSSSGLLIIAFFGLQSAGFYLVLNWLPTILVDFGFSGLNAGNLLALTTIVGVPVATISSFFFKRFQNLGTFAAGVSLISVLGYALLVFSSEFTVLGCLMIGAGQAVTFPLALTLIASRPTTSGLVTQLSTLAQGGGYLFAAVATFAAGFANDLTGNWSASLVLIMAITILQALIGFFAGRPARIG